MIVGYVQLLSKTNFVIVYNVVFVKDNRHRYSIFEMERTVVFKTATE